MIVTDHAVEEASKELWDSNDWATKLLRLWEWEDEVDGLGSVVSRVEVFLSAPVGLNLGDVRLDGSFMEKVVFRGSLDQLAWVLVSVCPGLNLGHVVIQVLASAQGSWEL